MLCFRYLVQSAILNLTLLVEYSLLKFTLYSIFIKYLLPKPCFSVYPFTVHCGKCTITLLVVFFPSFFLSYFDFLSARDALSQMGSWLSLHRPDEDGAWKVSVLQVDITWLSFDGLSSTESNQTLRAQTAFLSSPWFLGLAACFVTPRDIVQRWQQSSLKGRYSLIHKKPVS